MDGLGVHLLGCEVGLCCGVGHFGFLVRVFAFYTLDSLMLIHSTQGSSDVDVSLNGCHEAVNHFPFYSTRLTYIRPRAYRATATKVTCSLIYNSLLDDINTSTSSIMTRSACQPEPTSSKPYVNPINLLPSPKNLLPGPGAEPPNPPHPNRT